MIFSVLYKLNITSDFKHFLKGSWPLRFLLTLDYVILILCDFCHNLAFLKLTTIKKLLIQHYKLSLTTLIITHIQYPIFTITSQLYLWCLMPPNSKLLEYYTYLRVHKLERFEYREQILSEYRSATSWFFWSHSNSSVLAVNKRRACDIIWWEKSHIFQELEQNRHNLFPSLRVIRESNKIMHITHSVTIKHCKLLLLLIKSIRMPLNVVDQHGGMGKSSLLYRRCTLTYARIFM